MSVSKGFGAKLFFSQCVHTPQLNGLSVGYELRMFRYEQLANLMFKALPDFALNYSELRTLDVENMVEKLLRAARAVYATDKYRRRGEFGELLLHLIMKDFFETVPAISKIYYKDGPNDTVKGFDAVHVVVGADGLELWVGEAKFYDSARKAIRDVASELVQHSQRDYLRSEFLFIGNKIDPSWPHADDLRKFLDPAVSLDVVFKRMKIAVLVTYDSPVVQEYRVDSEAYRRDLCEEILSHHAAFRSENLPEQVDIVLLMIPLEFKAKLLDVLQRKLEAYQAL